METLKLRFTREKETKNTVRYKEELGDVAHSDKEIAIGTLYIQKDVFDGEVPETLLVTVEAEKVE